MEKHIRSDHFQRFWEKSLFIYDRLPCLTLRQDLTSPSSCIRMSNILLSWYSPVLIKVYCKNGNLGEVRVIIMWSRKHLNWQTRLPRPGPGSSHGGSGNDPGREAGEADLLLGGCAGSVRAIITLFIRLGSSDNIPQHYQESNSHYK